MKTKKFKLMWADIHHKGKEITPWYYFDFDKFNELGYRDEDISEFIKEMKKYAQKEIKERADKIKNTDENKINEIQKEIMNKYVPLKRFIFEDNSKEITITEKNFTEYSHFLASLEMIIHSFVIANPETVDEDILHALKKIRKNPLLEPSRSEEDALTFAIAYGMSRALQQKRLAINEINVVLDWLIHEVEERMQKNESYIKWLKEFMESSPIKSFSSNKKSEKYGH